MWKKLNFVIKLFVLLCIVCLFIALYVLNVNNVNKNIKKEENIKTVSEKNTVEKYTYLIENEKLYVTANDGNFHEVPVESQKIFGITSDNEIKEGLYQITEEKIVFIYKENNKIKLIVCDDGGKTWNNLDLSNNDMSGDVMYIHFSSQNEAKIVICSDVAMRKAMALIFESNDGGKSWNKKQSGDEGYIGINLESKIEFFDNNFGFISSFENGTSSATLYMTNDGGDSFNEVKLPEQQLNPINNNIYLNWSEIYDTPSVPKLEDNNLIITVSQGSDGDYLGGKICAKYISKDMGKSWEFLEEYIPSEN